MTAQTAPGLTYPEIAKRVRRHGWKLNRKQVARIEARALRKIRDALIDDPDIINYLESLKS